MNIEKKTLSISFLIFTVSALLAFNLFGTPQNLQKEPGLEVNTSNEIATVDFENQSFDIMLENSAEAAFYLDKDRDGSADRKFEIVSDKNVHREYKILDFPENIYELKIRYQDDPEETGDAWMEVESIELLR